MILYWLFYDRFDSLVYISPRRTIPAGRYRRISSTGSSFSAIDSNFTAARTGRVEWVQFTHFFPAIIRSFAHCSLYSPSSPHLHTFKLKWQSICRRPLHSSAPRQAIKWQKCNPAIGNLMEAKGTNIIKKKLQRNANCEWFSPGEEALDMHCTDGEGEKALDLNLTNMMGKNTVYEWRWQSNKASICQLTIETRLGVGGHREFLWENINHVNGLSRGVG